MRARGANVTDIVVLVVAVDDGVMPQTEEAISHAKAAGVSIVVALNKIDKPNANVMRTKQQLAALELNPPEWGGNTEMVETSATTGHGIDALLETILLEAELMELKANPDRDATGVVLEAEITEGRGAVARLLVQNGTLRKGDAILAGAGFGRVRGIADSDGNSIDEVPPATPVEVSGLDEVPLAGDTFYVLSDIQKARLMALEKKDRLRDSSLASRRHVTLDNIFSVIEAEAAKEIRLIIKADVTGSLEVLQRAVKELATKEVKVKVIHSAVGAINESDVLLADASDAIILGFMVVPDENARHLAKDKGVDVQFYQVIYDMTDDLKKAMEGLLDPEEKEAVLGHLEVRNTFRASRIGVIAGCYVTDGRIERNDRLRIIRDGTIIYTGVIDSLKRFKDDAREVKEGFECGLKVKGYNDIKVADTIEAFVIKKVARTLESTR
jgi:translation initiation factor IF-2